MVVPTLKKALAAKRESRQIEFKEVIDVTSKRDWCEITKDVIAIANSGGGIIVFGLDSRGQPTGADLTALGALDPATIADRIQFYTRTQLIDFDVWEAEKAGQELIVWIIDGSDVPTVFCQPGTYPIPGGKQKTAFGQGTVYFRHGAKSEPGTTEDIAKSFAGKLELIRKEWVRNVRKVVTAPAGSRVTILPVDTSAVAVSQFEDVTKSDADSAVPIRITNDPTAPAYRGLDTDRTYPFRQKELVAEVRGRLRKSISFNSFDVLVVRQIYMIDKKTDFAYQPKFGSRQYIAKNSLIGWSLRHKWTQISFNRQDPNTIGANVKCPARVGRDSAAYCAGWFQGIPPAFGELRFANSPYRMQPPELVVSLSRAAPGASRVTRRDRRGHCRAPCRTKSVTVRLP